MNTVNVRNTMELKESKIRYAKWNSECAFKRLQITRKIKSELISGISSYASDLPVNTREIYDEIIEKLESVEKAEIDIIGRGE